MTKIMLARHGRTAWNAEGRLQGHTDIELDDTGRDQARALAAGLASAKIAAVITSDLARARETGAIIAEALALAPPRIEPELRERRFGIFEGLTRNEISVRYPDAWRAWTGATEAPPGGETKTDAIARLTRALRRIVDDSDGRVLVVSHGGVMRLWLMDLLGTTIPLVGNGTMYLVDHDGTSFSARKR
jgi:probable phosphoglycerate mutase